MSDFRSKLMSFQVATGMLSDTKSESATITSNETMSNSAQTMTMKDRLVHLWETTQLKSSLKNSRKKRPVSPTANNDEPIHVAVCATILSKLPHEMIWRSWMGDTDDGLETSKNIKASMFIHAKTPSAVANGSWTKSHLIPISHNPNWNDIRIVQAMLSLATYALKGDATHILFVTESCIPISSLEELGEEIRKQGYEKSFVNPYGETSSRCTRFDEHACFSISDLPHSSIRKQLPGWCLLSRKHVQAILDIPKNHLGGEELYPLFSKVWAPEEVFFPTALSLLGLLDPDEIVGKGIVWAKWDTRSQGRDRAHPLTYDGKFGKALVEEVRRDGCFFMRKLRHQISTNHWKGVMKERNFAEIYNNEANATSNTRKQK